MLTSIKDYVKEIKLDDPQQNLRVKKNEEELKKLRGVFSKYARHDLSIDEIMELEKEAYREAREEAAVERYLRSYDITGR